MGKSKTKRRSYPAEGVTSYGGTPKSGQEGLDLASEQ